jgi:hypothetical protein
MVKKSLARVVSVLPESQQHQTRQGYWQVKSKTLKMIPPLYSLLNLEHTLDSGLTAKGRAKANGGSTTIFL